MAADFYYKAIDPRNPSGPRIDVVFPADLTLYYYKYAPVRYENLRAAQFVLDHTERIFYGVREYNEGGWCYTARPTEWFVRENKTAPFPDGLVFVVYLNPMMRVYECRAEDAANDDPMCPVNWQSRYRGLVWKRTS